MAQPRVGLAGLIPVTNGTQVISCSNSTAQAINSTVATSHVVDASVETNDVRYWAASAPTLSTGILLQKDQVYRISGITVDWNLQFQRSTGTALVHVIGYRHEA